MIWGAVELAVLLVYAACAATLVVRMVFVRLIWDRYHEEAEIFRGEILQALDAAQRFALIDSQDPTRNLSACLYLFRAEMALSEAESCRLALWLNPALFNLFERSQRFVDDALEL